MADTSLTQSPQVDASAPPSDRSGSKTLEHGLDVLLAVAKGARTLAQAQQVAQTSRSTTHRLIQSLRTYGLIRDTAEGLQLGPRMIELGFLAVSENPLPSVARPALVSLQNRVHDTVHLGVREGNSILYLDKLSGTRGTIMRSRIGSRMPLSRTGIGRALLLDSPDDWEPLFNQDKDWHADPTISTAIPTSPDQFAELMRDYVSWGYTFDLEENEVGIRGVGAPIRGGNGEIIGAISVAASAPYLPESRMHKLGPIVRSTALHISHLMGAPAGPAT
jgi:DNA-binding IclR family transcriptional regulator